MKTFDAVRTVNPVKLGSRMESFFASTGHSPCVITHDGGPFVSVVQGAFEVLVPMPNISFLTPAKKAEEKKAATK